MFRSPPHQSTGPACLRCLFFPLKSTFTQDPLVKETGGFSCFLDSAHREVTQLTRAHKSLFKWGLPLFQNVIKRGTHSVAGVERGALGVRLVRVIGIRIIAGCTIDDYRFLAAVLL